MEKKCIQKFDVHFTLRDNMTDLGTVMKIILKRTAGK